MLINFPDDQHITKSKNIHLKQANIQPSEAVLKPEFPWEVPRTNMYGSVFRSNLGYEMYYQCGNAVCVAYAHSVDGIQWHKPLINITDLSSSVPDFEPVDKDRNAIAKPALRDGQQLTNLVAGCHMPSIICEPDSVEPYKMLAFGDEGYHVFFSGDGKRFKPCADNPVIKLMTYHNPTTNKTWCSDVAPCFKDQTGYTTMVKTYVVDDQKRTRRCIGRSTSTDFKNWSAVETIWQPGAQEDAIARDRGFEWADFYGLCPFPHGSGYLGFLWLFEIEKELPRGTNLGKIEVFLAYSPDGINWRRIEEKPLIPWDLNFGHDGGMVTTPSAPVFDDEEIKLYYSDSNYEHGFAERDFTKELVAPTWVIRCAVIKKERLVGVYSEQGTLEFADINFKSHQLRLNIDCSDGFVKIEYYEDGKILSTETIKNVDSTDFTPAITPPISDHILLVVTLQKATIFAIEVINRMEFSE